MRKSKKENWIAIVMVVVGLRWWLCSFYGALISGLGRVKEAAKILEGCSSKTIMAYTWKLESC
jgi:hypothetical protein